MDQVGNFTITNGGTGYVGGDPGGDYVTVVGGNGDAQALVTTVSAGGVITGLSMGAHGHSKGSGYTTGSANLSGGSGTGAVISITSITNNGYRQSVTSAGLVVTGPGMTADGLDITQMTGNATCATACHKGTSATNTAPWGNFTTPSIHLTCNSCHGDASNYGPTASNTGLGNGFSGTGGHKVHLYSVGGSHGNQLLGGTKIVLGSFSTVIDMNGNSDKVCAACHPDNTNDLWSQGRADDGSKKAYPHATDGTNVQAKNANFTAPANIVFTNASGLADTTGKLSCTNNCHFNKSSVQSANPTWTASSGCELCHNHTATEAANNSALVMGGRALSYAHSLHFNQISAMHVGSARRAGFRPAATATLARIRSTRLADRSSFSCL